MQFKMWLLSVVRQRNTNTNYIGMLQRRRRAGPRRFYKASAGGRLAIAPRINRSTIRLEHTARGKCHPMEGVFHEQHFYNFWTIATTFSMHLGAKYAVGLKQVLSHAETNATSEQLQTDFGCPTVLERTSIDTPN